MSLGDTITLTREQDKAVSALIGEAEDGARSAYLHGWPGTGKTTSGRQLVTRLRERGWRVSLMAMTGRAARQLHLATDETTSTVHQCLWQWVSTGSDGQPIFHDPQPLGVPGVRTAVLIDEYSLVPPEVGDELRSQLGPRDSLFGIGDPGQIPGMSKSGKAEFDPAFLRPTAVLDTVHRQAMENPLIRILTAMRLDKKPIPQGRVGEAYHRRPGNLLEAAAWFLDAQGGGGSTDTATVLSFTNDTRRRLNKNVRAFLGQQEACPVGSRLMVLKNNHSLGIVNGEVIEVSSSRPWMPFGIRSEDLPDDWGPATIRWRNYQGHLQEATIHTGLLGESTYQQYRDWELSRQSPSYQQCMYADYGWGMTGHKAQGSEWPRGIILLDAAARRWRDRDAKTAWRILYTMLSRFKESALVLDL